MSGSGSLVLAPPVRACPGPEIADAVGALVDPAGGVTPTGWGTPAFGRRVERVRAHLAPIASRALLAASFEREASRLAAPIRPAGLAADSVRVAYALRWLELGGGVRLPAWPAWVTPV